MSTSRKDIRMLDASSGKETSESSHSSNGPTIDVARTAGRLDSGRQDS